LAQDEQKEPTAHVDLHDQPGGLHPPRKLCRKLSCENIDTQHANPVSTSTSTQCLNTCKHTNTSTLIDQFLDHHNTVINRLSLQRSICLYCFL
jgi:hypothetical protein